MCPRVKQWLLKELSLHPAAVCEHRSVFIGYLMPRVLGYIFCKMFDGSVRESQVRYNFRFGWYRYRPLSRVIGTETNEEWPGQRATAHCSQGEENGHQVS